MKSNSYLLESHLPPPPPPYIIRRRGDAREPQAAGRWSAAPATGCALVARGRLVALLSACGTDAVKEHAAGALGNLAWNNTDNMVTIAQAGAIAPLVALAIIYG